MTIGSFSRLRVSQNRRFLLREDGSPFFWLGDTAWQLFHSLDRKSAERYLRDRSKKGFNVVQAVILAECDGIRTGNAYGRLPLTRNEQGEYDPELVDLTGDYTYFDHVDYVLDRAAEEGIYVALLPTWGDKYNLAHGLGPVIFNPDNARAYGRWIGERYRERENIVWAMGGDRSLDNDEHRMVIRAMAEGIKDGDEGRHLMTFHPPGGCSSSAFVHEEEWLDFHMIQSGHGFDGLENYSRVEADYRRAPVRPVLDGEPRYEDHPKAFKAENGYYDAADVRQAAYWSVFAGAFGHTYGHHSIWRMSSEIGEYFVMTWQEALDRPGASQMRHVRALVESRPFLDRVPDQGLVSNQYNGHNHIRATRGDSYAFVYSPNGLPIEVSMGRIRGESVVAHWFDPRTGRAVRIGEFKNDGTAQFIPLSHGRGDDSVLVLDDSSCDFPLPGERPYRP